MQPTDRELLQRFRTGADDAFRELVERYHERVQTWALRRVDRKEQAEDVAQQTFFRLFRYAAKETSDELTGDSIEHLVFAMLVRAAIDAVRQERTYRQLLRDVARLAMKKPEPTDAGVAAEALIREIRAALAILGPRIVETAVEYFTEECTAGELAQRSGTPVNTIRKRIRRARAILARHLGFSTGENDGMEPVAPRKPDSGLS